MPRRPKDQLDAGRAYYARHMPGIDVRVFGPLWHLFTLGHLVATDLDGIARELGCSFADLDLLGTLAIEEPAPLRATDLASALYISNAVVSTRLARLERDGMIARRPSPRDRRASDLHLTTKGRALVEAAIGEITARAKLIRFFRQLSAEDQATLGRLLGDLHQRFDREFVGGAYTAD